MERILSDTFKFQEVKFDKIKEELNYLLDEEKEIRKFLKELKDKNVITDSEFKFLNPCGSQPGVLYGLCKFHKESMGNSPPFRPILSAINTPSYKLAKCLIPLLSDLTKNDYLSKDSFSFAQGVRSQNFYLYMTSFDIDSLFTNFLWMKV